jgi:hypothetical protein
MDQDQKVRENRLRRMAHRLGLDIKKSRVRTVHVDDWGEYSVVDRKTGEVIAGEKQELSLDRVELILKAKEELIRREREG